MSPYAEIIMIVCLILITILLSMILTEITGALNHEVFIEMYEI